MLNQVEDDSSSAQSIGDVKANVESSLNSDSIGDIKSVSELVVVPAAFINNKGKLLDLLAKNKLKSDNLLVSVNTSLQKGPFTGKIVAT